MEDKLATELAKKIYKLFIEETDINNYREQNKIGYITWVVGERYKILTHSIQNVGKVKNKDFIVVSKMEEKETPLLDLNMIKSHVRGNSNYSIFPSKNLTSKFIIFKISAKSLDLSKEIGLQVIAVLNHIYEVNTKDIHVAFVESNVYHIALFINVSQPESLIKQFYDCVTSFIYYEHHEVMLELLPQLTHPIELPLGKNNMTGIDYVFVNKGNFHNMTVSESHDYLIQIKQIPPHVLSNSIKNNKPYVLMSTLSRKITVSKSELFPILQIGTMRQNQLAYALLLSSKKYGPQFELTMSKAAELLGIKGNNTIFNAFKHLEKVGFINIQRENHSFYSKNSYKIINPIAFNSEERTITVPYLADEVSFKKAICCLFSKQELKKILSRSEFENRWKIY